MNEHQNPQWLLGGERIDEGLFIQEFLWSYPMKYVNGVFYTRLGPQRDEDVLRRIFYEQLQPYISSGLARRVNALLELLRLQALALELPVQEDVIPVYNGTFHLDKGFTTDMDICRHRLPVVYNCHLPQPEAWLRFLEELLEEEDIPTLQEYMGYCLLPTTCAQKMLSIIGSGGEGKSRIGVVMKALLGSAMASGSLAKVEMSPFARADLENLLLFVDDDLKMEALNQTNHLKTIITADTPMDVERKYVQSYQAQLYTRFLAFGNTSLQAVNDRSNGFFRRQIILRAKPVRPGRVDDPFLGKKLAAERDSIFLWALEGLYCLRQNNYRFTLSSHAQENREQLIYSSDSVRAFLDSQGYVVPDPNGCIPSRVLYDRYRSWCRDNSVDPLVQAVFSRQMMDLAGERELYYSNAIRIPNGRTARGFRGLRAV